MNNKDYLTIKEYAEIKGCSIQYVYKLCSTKLKPFVEIVESRKCLKIEVLDIDVLNHSTKFSTNSTNNSTKLVESVESVENDDISTSSFKNESEIIRINKRNEEIIDELRQQLKDKDIQILELTRHIAELSAKTTELFENNQKLQLNYQLLLSDGKHINNNNVDIESASAEETEEIKPKKGFLSRFFK